jgi:succinyldiaminopimelate transaminase
MAEPSHHWLITVAWMRKNPVLAQLGSYAIGEIQNRVRSMREAGQELIDFSIGDPREPTPGFVREAVRQAIPEVSQYPTARGLPAMRAAVAGYVHRRFGVEVDPDTQVLPTSGSKEAVFSTPLAFVDAAAGDVVAWPTPGYPIYERGARMAGAVGMPIALDGDFVFTADRISDWSRIRMVWICTPHNPAGSVTPRDELVRFVDRSRDAGALLCSDECYIDLHDDADERPTSVLEVAGPGSRDVLSYFSLSKRSGMTGYRSGAIVGDAEAIAVLASFRTSTGTASPEFVQAGAIAAWNDDAHVAERRVIFAAKRRILGAAFDRLGYEVVGSTAGIYLWVRVPDDVAVAARLLDSGIVVSPGRAFGPGGEGHIRLALVPALADCDRAAEAVITCLDES